jgi:hypothetical protein
MLISIHDDMFLILLAQWHFCDAQISRASAWSLGEAWSSWSLSASRSTSYDRYFVRDGSPKVEKEVVDEEQSPRADGEQSHEYLGVAY